MITKQQFTKCGHRGHGAHCHRCAEADRLEAIAEGTAKPANEDRRRKGKPEAFDGWKEADFRQAAKDLRAAYQPKSGRNKSRPTQVETA